MAGLRLVLSCLLLALGARTAGALLDDASDPGTPTSTSNIITDQRTDAEWSARFGGDQGRYVRQTKGPGIILYNQTDISRITIEFYTRSSALSEGSWNLLIFLGEHKVGQVYAKIDVGARLAGSTEPKVRSFGAPAASVSGKRRAQRLRAHRASLHPPRIFAPSRPAWGRRCATPTRRACDRDACAARVCADRVVSRSVFELSMIRIERPSAARASATSGTRRRIASLAVLCCRGRAWGARPGVSAAGRAQLAACAPPRTGAAVTRGLPRIGRAPSPRVLAVRR